MNEFNRAQDSWAPSNASITEMNIIGSDPNPAVSRSEIYIDADRPRNNTDSNSLVFGSITPNRWPPQPPTYNELILKPDVSAINYQSQTSLSPQNTEPPNQISSANQDLIVLPTYESLKE